MEAACVRIDRVIVTQSALRESRLAGFLNYSCFVLHKYPGLLSEYVHFNNVGGY